MNKEFGSDFEYYPDIKKEEFLFELIDDSYFLMFSGRVALYNILLFGINRYNWKRVGFPSYYCHEVVEFCKTLNVEIVYYDYNPLSEEEELIWDDREDHVFINVDYFGIKKCNTGSIKHSVIIDDLTHNLLSLKDTDAAYSFASLRKQLPVATGGVCISRDGDLVIKSERTALSEKLAIQKMSAMYLKSEYLLGNLPNKDVFRKLFAEAEAQFHSSHTNSELPAIVRSQLFSLDAQTLIKKTYQNIAVAHNCLNLSSKIRLINKAGDTAMGLLFLCESHEIRNRFKDYLIQQNIFPAVLWPHQFRVKDADVEGRFLFVHCDFRYSAEDIQFITHTINNFRSNV